MAIINDGFYADVNFAGANNSNIGTWNDDILHTGGGSGGGTVTPNTSSTTGSFNGLGNTVGGVSGWFDINDIFTGNDNNDDENSGNDGSSSGITNNLFVDNTTNNTSQGSSNSSTQILEKINTELNYIMNSLKIKQDNEVINQIQISSPQIVSVGSALCSDIGFFDIHGRQYKNFIFKINNSYYGVSYDYYKDNEIITDQVFSDTNINLTLEKLKRNVVKTTKYTYVFEDKVNNNITYNEYSGEIVHLGNNVYVGSSIPEQDNLISTTVTSKYDDKFGSFTNVAVINNIPYILSSDNQIYKLNENQYTKKTLQFGYITYNFKNNAVNLYIGDENNPENPQSLTFNKQDIIKDNGLKQTYYTTSYNFVDDNYVQYYSIIKFSYTPSIKNFETNSFSLNTIDKKNVLMFINTYQLTNNQSFSLIDSKNIYFDVKNTESGTFFAYEYNKIISSHYSVNPEPITSISKAQFSQNKILNNGIYTYQLTYNTDIYSFRDNIEVLNYKTKTLIPNTTVSITYTYTNILTNTEVNFINNNESIFFINNEYYGLNVDYVSNNVQVTAEEPAETTDGEQTELISEEPTETPTENTNVVSQYTFHLVEVFERSYFNDEYFSEHTTKKILTKNSQDYFTTYKPIPFIIKNDIKMYESSDYKFNPPIYGDIIFNTTKEEDGVTYNVISYESTILKDSFWFKQHKEEVLPLLINSYSYNVSPLEISSANVIPGNKEEVLNKIYKPEITYYDYVNTYNEKYEFAYIDNKNIQHIYEDKVIFNNNTYYGILKITKTVADKSYVADELIPLIRNLRVETEPVLQKLTYRESSYVNQSVIMDSSFRLLNGCKVNITNQTFIPTAYKDIISINPNTHEPEIQQVIEHESYIAYEYSIDEVPFITNTYIYHQNGLTINNIDELQKSTQNLTYLSLLSELPNALCSSKSELSDSLKLMSSGINSKLSDLIQYLKTSNDVSDKNLLAGLHLNNDTAKANNIELVSSLSNLNLGIDNSLTYLINKYEDLESQNILSNKVNTSNIIQSNKKHLDRVSDSISYSGDKVNSALSYISYILCLSNNVSKLSENTNISLIGKQVFEEVVTLSYIAEPIKGSKLTNKVPKYTYSYSYVNKYYATPESAEILSYIDISNANDLDALIGLHKINDSYQYMVDDNIYEVSKTKYLGIADILYDIYLNLKVQSKQSFIMDVTKGIFVNNNVIDRLAYTSPNELAKKSVYLANALWEELENSNVLCE